MSKYSFDQIPLALGLVLKNGVEANKKVQTYANKEKDEVYKQAINDFSDYERDTITSLFNSVITNFYNDYTPRFYRRKKKLYTILNIRYDEEGFIDLSDNMYTDENMTQDRRGYNLYELVFEKGWHGGRRGNPVDKNKPYYRVPPRWDAWGRPAVQYNAPEYHNSPKYEIDCKIMSMANKEFKEKFEEITQDKFYNVLVPKIKERMKKEHQEAMENVIRVFK